MNRLNLFFMFFSAFVSSALHYTINEEGNFEQALKAYVYRDEVSYKNFLKDEASQEPLSIYKEDTCDEIFKKQDLKVGESTKILKNQLPKCYTPKQILSLEKPL